MERSDFYEQAMQPGFPDEIALQIERPKDDPPEVLFSEEGFDTIAETLKHFAMARSYAHHVAAGGRGPKKLRATIKLDFSPGDPAEDAGPYFLLIDGATREEAG